MDLKDKYVQKNTDKWLKKIADHYTKHSVDDIRDFKNIQENYDLMSGIMNLDDINKAFNPMDLKQSKLDLLNANEIIPIIIPSINTLIGEIYDRNIDFRAFVVNPDAISEKETAIKQQLDAKMQSLVEQQDLSEEEMEIELTKIRQWRKYEAQDIRERFANHIIKDHIERLRFQRKSKDGWKDVIANSQEFFRFGLVNGNVEMEPIYPLDLRIHGLPRTGEVHHSEAIIYTRYLTITEIHQEYNLDKKDIDKLLRDETGLGTVTDAATIVFSNINESDNEGNLILDPADNKFMAEEEYMGKQGEKVLVRTVYFKALRKVATLFYIDDETGDEKSQLVDGEYEPVEQEGEHIKVDYIPEYWQITKIGHDVYTNGKVCDVQMRDMNNPKIVYAPITGKIARTGNKVTKSVVDILKPIQYQWTAFSKKVQLLWSRNYGKLVRIDISRIPKKYGFDLDLFMSWITSFGIIVEDPFNEAVKGQPSGQFQSSVGQVDLELSSSIQQALSYMVYLRQLADEIVGITRQRKGEMMASDGMGTTQESIQRSVKMTEELFQEHHDLQRTLLKYILEYAKVSLVNGENKKMQYITDDMIYHLYEVEPKIFTSCDFGIFINNSRRQMEQEQLFMQLAHAYAQNGVIQMSEIMDLYNTNSISDKINKLKIAEEEADIKRKQEQERQMEHDQQMQQQMGEMKQQEMEHELKLQELKNEGSIQVAMINAQVKLDIEDIKSEQNNEDNETKKDVEETKARNNYVKQQSKDKAKK